MEENGMKHYIGVTFALSMMLGMYCVFSPVRSDDGFTIAFVIKYVVSLIASMVIIGVVAGQRDAEAELVAALMPLMLTSAEAYIGWYSYALAGVMAAVAIVRSVANIYRIKKEYQVNGLDYHDDDEIGELIKGYNQCNIIIASIIYLFIAFVVIGVKSGELIWFLNTDSEPPAYEESSDNIVVIEPEVLTQVIEPDYEYVKNYDSYDSEGRLKALEMIYANEQKVLGLSDTADIELADLGEAYGERVRRGDYNNKDKVIRINEGIIDDFDAALETLLHETGHQYQHELVSTGADSSGLAYFDDIRVYREEFAHHKNVDDESEFEEYINQKIEIDTREYAKERVKYYKQILEEL